MNKIIIFTLITSFVLLISCNGPNNNTPSESRVDAAERLSGGETTVFIASSQAFSTPAPNLSAKSLDEHLVGDLNFEQNFVKAPSLVNSGLGPLFNNVSCINCHVSDGRGRPPLGSEDLETMLIRISVAGTDQHGGPNPVPGFGGQLQIKSIFGYKPEGNIIITYSEIAGTYPDGTHYSLRKPNYNLTGQIPTSINISPRVAPSVFGLGLLEAIDEIDILTLADENDLDEDNISGKPNYVWDVQTQSTALGKFGWKANTPNLLQQSAAAYVNDMGITNPMFQMESCHNNAECDTLDDDPEITDKILKSVEFYVQTLAVPARRDFDDIDVLTGKELFNQVECATCHVAEFKTGNHKIAELSQQRIFPYSDLLLHDMGDDLSDNRSDFHATGNEWRTTPLWGLGLINIVNGHTNLLHDGRARNIEEAILWHGGESQKSKEKYMSLSKDKREKILKFLNSL
jgi:CxxC motif-containing protein (DUF1111 family)